ncbi:MULTISPECIES: hypothetical protein [Halomonadaceae]|jgi:hypothetical protein|uniref:Uncharacterized protein n=1 Tax=Vreelandella aquamarina TaxID=77097 RepID=A0A0D7UTQ7_9GAMM|nr:MULTISPECIES: hypothetical protein [Halomonas]KTG22964.1 hypothetical protein AUR68_24525 [Idiomarina sp. H105]MEC8901971.1 hypothetical protein [Pseudomonadota bacterium]OAE89846.1 hypothetical protein AWR38_24565 [Idiomarina sp. WRN-38]KJD18015.1 hypothetical protein VE30_15505 [Halomonas meridiana]MCC4291811.1 hypothetical protein [Halomonas axialensis]|tara:strand:+ start:2623 stop:3054 length:432 start_codon:yes stop_codon:yes gene_type:complete
MPQDDFYTKMRAGLSALLRQWRSLGQADADQLALILAETARVAKLGTPDATPSGATLEQWSQDQQGEMPLWAPRTAVFLLNQMPARPTPQSDEEACAWAYCWLRNRSFDSLDAARAALPAHLAGPLDEALAAAWSDQQGLRLV